MTDFIRRVREILDAKDGRKLILGVRVPQQLAGCLAWGLDIPTWLRKGLIDFVAPGDFGFTDFNEKWENFTSIARETDCLVYPQTQPKIGIESLQFYLIRQAGFLDKLGMTDPGSSFFL